MLTFFRSRMFTPAFKLFAGMAVAGLTGALLFAITTEDNTWTFDGTFPFVHVENVIETVVGPISLGWKGPVGNHFGYLVLLAFAGAAAFLAGMLVWFRDADPEAQAEAIQLDTVPLTRAPRAVSYWPILFAFDAALIMVGLAVNNWYLIAGLFLLGIIGAAWAFQNWAYRATGDDAVNDELYHRFIDPMRVPVAAVVLIAIVALAFSRVLLAAPNEGASVWIFLGVGALLGAVLVAVGLSAKLSKNAIAALLVVGVLIFLAAGITAAFLGERDFEHHEGGATTEHDQGGATEHGGEGEGSLAPIGADGATGYGATHR